MISSQWIPPIATLWIFIGTIQQVRHLERGREKMKKAIKSDRKKDVRRKKLCPTYKFLYVLFSVTKSWFLLGFSSSSGNITAIIKKSTSEKVPTSISEITIKHLHKNIIIPQLWQSGLLMPNVCLKIQLRLKM